MTILLAEDEQAVRKFIAKFLESSGYTVLSAADGESALEISRTFDGKIELLLADIQMPGLTGIELAKRLFSERPVTKILLMSSLYPADLEKNGAWEFIRKPFLSDSLREKIRGLLPEQPQ